MFAAGGGRARRTSGVPYMSRKAFGIASASVGIGVSTCPCSRSIDLYTKSVWYAVPCSKMRVALGRALPAGVRAVATAASSDGSSGVPARESLCSELLRDAASRNASAAATPMGLKARRGASERRRA